MLNYRTNGIGDDCAFVVGELTEKDLAEFESSGFEMLALNSALGWDGKAGALAAADAGFSRYLSILSLDDPFDVTFLSEAARSAAGLHLGLGCVGRLRAAEFARLQEIRLVSPGKKLDVDLRGAIGLRKLVANGDHIKDASALEGLHLDEMEIVKPLLSPVNLPPMPGLRAASFSHWPKLNGFSALDFPALEKLNLSCCKKIEGYGSIAKLDKLQRLVLDECTPVESASVFLSLKNLQILRLQGTKIIDPDISPLLRTGLRHLFLTSYGHYAQSTREIEKSVNSRMDPSN